MGDNNAFTSDPVIEDCKPIAGMGFHSGPMDFSVQYGVPNKIDSTIKFDTEYTSSIAIAKRGKHPIVAKSITTEDVKSSVVVDDWEKKNDKAITYRRGTGPSNE